VGGHLRSIYKFFKIGTFPIGGRRGGGMDGCTSAKVCAVGTRGGHHPNSNLERDDLAALPRYFAFKISRPTLRPTNPSRRFPTSRTPPWTGLPNLSLL
jgi:hypothetical protein